MKFYSQKLFLPISDPLIPLDPIRFDYTSSVQTYVVPESCYQLHVDCVGSAGGHIEGGSAYWSKGGRVECDLEVTPGQVLYLYVGSIGTTSPGWNGGGRKNEGQQLVNDQTAGGGASDIRTVPATAGSWYDTSHTSWDTDVSLLSRLVVAGAGGGTNGYQSDCMAGNGGGLEGQDGRGSVDQVNAGGGTQTAGGVAARINAIQGEDGVFGKGGDAKYRNNTTFPESGGGGGWYGGGAGVLGGSGGGSSYTHPTLCSKVFHTQGYSQATGNGWIIITPMIRPDYSTDAVWFYYTGAVQTYTVPMGCKKLHVEAIGARGGGVDSGVTKAGKGGKVICDLTVSSGQVLYLYVGGAGGNNPGWNGGGQRNTGNTYPDAGGGASDIRTVPATAGSWYDTSHTSWDTDVSLLSRLVVAGGGGGYSQNARGGNGGGLEGEVVDGGRATPCTPATQNAGGNGAIFGGSEVGGNGVFGRGGDGFYNDSMFSNYSSAGGGGGWYGGGAGIYFQPGGGGSSYTHPTLCSNVEHEQGSEEGSAHGYIVIEPLK